MKEPLIKLNTCQNTNIAVKNLVIIPARGGSKGVPGKNLKKIAGMPLIYWSIKAALESKSVDRIIVSTDSQEIAKLSKSFGAETPFIRPPEISGDTATTESAVIHCLNFLSQRNETLPENIILLQPTSPVRKQATIDEAFKYFEKNEASSLLSVNRFDHFLWKNMDSPVALYDYKNRPRRQDIKPIDYKFIENGSIYITKADQYLNDGNRLCNSPICYELSEEESFEIDTHLDFIIVETILRRVNKK